MGLYKVKKSDCIIKDNKPGSGFRRIFNRRLSKWLSLNEFIISELWDEAMNKKQIVTQNGWNLAKEAVKKYINCYQFILQQDENVKSDISHWFIASNKLQKYGHFRAGGDNRSFVKKKFVAPSLVGKVLEFIKNPRINQTESTTLIPMKLVNEIYDFYLLMLRQTMPASSRHVLYKDWVRIAEQSQREMIEALQTFMNDK